MKRIHTRKSISIPRFVTAVLSAVAGVFIVCLCILFLPYRLPERLTIVVASHPFQIITVNTADHTATVVRVSEDVHIGGAYALGKYPIASLWKMGGLDPKDRHLLAYSSQIAFGIPVQGYVGTTYDQLMDQTQTSDTIHDMFSLSGMLTLLTRQRVTNLRFRDILSLYKTTKSMRQSDIKFIDLNIQASSVDETLPDGSIRQSIDPERVDALLKNVFIYPEVRKEALSVGVANATDIPELASNISRQLVNSGMYVVTVTSEEKKLKQCDVTGKETALTSKTAEFILSEYHCTKHPAEESQREDIMLHIGTDIGSRYVPRITK